MSASNWAQCPRCTRRREREIEERAAKVRASYGIATPAEYERAVRNLRNIDPKPTAGDTFREDYEIYGAEDGTVKVDYAGSCRACGLKLAFKHTHAIPDIEAEVD